MKFLLYKTLNTNSLPKLTVYEKIKTDSDTLGIIWRLKSSIYKNGVVRIKGFYHTVTCWMIEELVLKSKVSRSAVIKSKAVGAGWWGDRR